MKTSNTVCAIALLATTCILSVAAAAQAEEVQARGPIPFSTFDKDSNGFVSEQEFNAVRVERIEKRQAAGMPTTGIFGPPTFQEFDTDGDGRLSEDEVIAEQIEIMEERNASMSESGRPGAGGNLPTFTDFDLNGDGVIVEEEFDQARSTRISRLAEQGFQMRNLPSAPAFGAIDTNGNGQISPDEFWAHQTQPVQQRMQ